MGVLAGIEDANRVDMRRCEYFVGTSAGSIVAAHLVAGRSPRRPDQIENGSPAPEAPSEPAGRLGVAGSRAARVTGEFALAAASTFAPLALGLATPGGALARATLLRRLPRPEQTLDGLRRHVAESGRPVRRTAPSHRGRPPVRAADRVRQPEGAVGNGRRRRGRVVQRPVAVRARRDRRPRVRRRRRLERHQHGRGAGGTRGARAVPESDREPPHDGDRALCVPQGLAHRRRRWRPSRSAAAALPSEPMARARTLPRRWAST